jgi:hypothetical protein
MVFFICECQETLKKAAVERHRFSCRRCVAVTCVDCNVRFPLESYGLHMTCVSEAQKYEKTAYRERPAKRDPQAEWVAVVAIAAAAGGEHARTLSSLANFSNVPRKVKPFIAFAKNSLRIWDEKKLAVLFAYVQSFMPPRPAANGGKEEADAPEVALVESGGVKEEEDIPTATSVEKAVTGTKRARTDDDDNGDGGDNDVAAAEKVTSFSSRKFILSHLKSAKKCRSKIEKLKLALVAAALVVDVEIDFDKVVAKLVKKGHIQITDGLVFLIQKKDDEE